MCNNEWGMEGNGTVLFSPLYNGEEVEEKSRKENEEAARTTLVSWAEPLTL